MRKALVCASITTALLVIGSAAGAKTYKPGQSAVTEGIKVTVFGVDEPYTPTTTGLIKPATGNHFVTVDLELTNKTGAPTTFSTFAGFHLLDGSNNEYNEDLGCATTTKPKAPGGELAPKQPLRGLVCFEVPDGSTKLSIEVKAGLTGGGVTFQLTNKTGKPIPPVKTK